jgi:hypothetical protein
MAPAASAVQQLSPAAAAVHVLGNLTIGVCHGCPPCHMRVAPQHSPGAEECR